MASDAIHFFAATDVGQVREHNEDNFLVDKKLQLFVVADGMGGHAAGEVASALAVRTIHEEVKKDAEVLARFASPKPDAPRVSVDDVVAILELAVQRACGRIHEEARRDAAKRGMGTTLSALLVLGQKGFVAHVGDSRIYMVRSGKVQQITEDHTVLNELIKRGKLTREQIERVPQKNAVTRAVGVYERVDVDSLVLEVLAGDQFLLASDGLTGYLSGPEELRGYLEVDGDNAAKSLVTLANSRGGKDNITVVLVRIAGEGDEQAKRYALKREILAKMPLFSRLSERELLRVMQVAEVKPFTDGATVIREGDRGDELFIVLHGRVKVVRGSEPISSLGAGEHFGEMALIRSVPRSANVVSDGPSELIVIRRADFFEILRKEHEIAVKMLWQFLGVLANRLDQTSHELKQARQEANEKESQPPLPRERMFSFDGEVTSPFYRQRILEELSRSDGKATTPPARSSDTPPGAPLVPSASKDNRDLASPTLGLAPMPTVAPAPLDKNASSLVPKATQPPPAVQASRRPPPLPVKASVRPPEDELHEQPTVPGSDARVLTRK